MSIEAEHQEALSFIENNRLMQNGMSYVDVHLLTSALLTGVPIWTLDKKLSQAADGLQIKYKNETPIPTIIKEISGQK
jgi:predicted nucleic acid-binding protein